MVFIPSGSQFDNDIPDASRRRGNPFWGFVGNMLGLEPERYPAPTGELDWQLDAVARRDPRISELNRPPGPPTIAADIVTEVAGHVRTAVKRLTKTDKAKAWLAERLQQGPVEATIIEAEGRKLGYPLKLLKIVKKRLRVVSVRKGANNWRWQLPMAKARKAGNE